jgi:predicted nucleotidyltransferase
MATGLKKTKHKHIILKEATMKLIKDPEKQAILDTLVDRIKNDPHESIDLMVCYGSAVTGPMAPLSDVDFFLVTNKKEGYQASKQFIYKNIGYDLWVVDHDFLKRISNFDTDLTSLIAHGQVVYARNEDLCQSFNTLKDKIASRENSQKLKDKALDHLKQIKAKAFDYIAGNHSNPWLFEEITGHVYSYIIYSKSDFTLKGPINALEELKAYKLSDHILELFKPELRISQEAKKALLLKVLPSLEDFLMESKSEHSPDLNGFFEELKSVYNKAYRYCDERNLYKVHQALKMIHEEVSYFIEDQKSDLLKLHLLRDLDFKDIKRQLTVHENKVRKAVENKGVKIHDFNDFNDLKTFIRS